MDNHTATQHEFTRRCLRLFTEDIPPVKRQKLEEDLPVFAEGINHFGGYDLDQQLAALTAERTQLRAESDSLRAEVERLQCECDVMRAVLNEITTSPEWELEPDTGEQK